MASSLPQQVTQLLVAWSDGDQTARDELIPLVYEELHRLAHHYMNRERPGHTLQTSALVNEAFVKLVDQRDVRWQNRAHFFGIAAQMMRRILVDHARKHAAVKRGKSFTRISLEEAAVFSEEHPRQMIAVDELLTRLASFDPQGSRIVELRFFAGLSLEETAEAMGLSTAKVRREWSTAKAWLTREMAREQASKPGN